MSNTTQLSNQTRVSNLFKGFKISRIKIEYTECNLSKIVRRHEHITHIDQEIPQSVYFRYLRSIIHHDGNINENMINRIKGMVKVKMYKLVFYVIVGYSRD